MRSKIATALFGFAAILLIQQPATAQVMRIQLDIAGYLCGF